MAASRTSPPTKRKAPARIPHGPAQVQELTSVHASVLDEARRVGLLEGDRTEHVSFRAPPALFEAAKREAGISSTSELGVLVLARPDPVAAFFRRTEGQLGPDHDLEH